MTTIRLEDRILYILDNSVGGSNDASTIARIIEYEDEKKAGSMHLAVKMAAKRLNDRGTIGIMPPQTESGRSSYLYYRKQVTP